MTPEIQAGIAAAKASFDLLKAMKSLSDASKINAITIELQQHILSTQQSLLAAQEAINRLLLDNANLAKQAELNKEFLEKKSRYKLTQVREGLVVYVYTAEGEQDQPTHWACPHCFADEKIAILQKASPTNRAYTCQSCDFRMVPEKDIPQPSIEIVRRGPRALEW